MRKELLIRDVPEDIYAAVKDAAHNRRQSQNEVLKLTLREGLLAPSLALSGEPPPRPLENPALPFSFVDLFAGIGGLRIGLEAAGGHSVFSSEWDKHSQATYTSWFGETPHGDITKIASRDIPDHDILAAGFPCQPFSLAGVSKKNSLGRAHGFKDAAQGTLFFTLARIIEDKRPPVLLLENVKNLRSHDGGQTWRVIKGTLEELGYCIHDKVIDAAGWVPQHRERIFIVGFDKDVFGAEVPFDFPSPSGGARHALRSILEENPDPRYTLSDHLWRYLRDYAAKHKAKGNGFGYGLPDLDGVARTLSARYHKDGSEILIDRGHRKSPRRLTPLEAGRLMGFPADKLAKKRVVSDTQSYRQFGNAVVPPVAEAVAKSIVRALWRHFEKHDNRCLLKQSASASTAALSKRTA